MPDGGDIVVAYRGTSFTIEYARQANGEVPGLEFFNSIDPRWQARIFYLFRRLGDAGRIENREMFRKETGEFFAFKAFQARLLCYFRADRRVVVTHGFRKKTDNIRKQEFERAARIKDDYENYLFGLRKRD